MAGLVALLSFCKNVQTFRLWCVAQLQVNKLGKNFSTHDQYPERAYKIWLIFMWSRREGLATGQTGICNTMTTISINQMPARRTHLWFIVCLVSGHGGLSLSLSLSLTLSLFCLLLLKYISIAYFTYGQAPCSIKSFGDTFNEPHNVRPNTFRMCEWSCPQLTPAIIAWPATAADMRLALIPFVYKCSNGWQNYTFLYCNSHRQSRSHIQNELPKRAESEPHPHRACSASGCSAVV